MQLQQQNVTNKTEILSDDALVWTAVFIDWLDGVDWIDWISHDWKFYEIFD